MSYTSTKEPAATQPQRMNDVLEISAVLSSLAGAAAAPNNVGHLHYAVVPNGFKREDLTAAVEATLPTPRRKSGTTRVHDLASLLLLCADQQASSGQAAGYIYADVEARSITAVWNDNRLAHAPGWRDYRAVFKAEYTPEFDKWLRNNKQHMTQEQFGEFLEDNLADLVDAAHLIEVAGTLVAKTDTQFYSSKRLDNGQTQLGYRETIDAKAGAEGNLTIPREFFLGIRVFKNGEAYKLKARLKYRLKNQTLDFWYELDRPEVTVEAAFTHYVTQAREHSGFIVLLGAAG